MNIFYIAVSVSIMFSFVFFIIPMHDSEVEFKRDYAIQEEYLKNINPNTTGAEKLIIARTACINGYNNASFDTWMPDSMRRTDIIELCVSELLFNK